MNIRRLYILLLILPLLFIYQGCSKSDDNPAEPAIDEAQVLADYMESQNLLESFPSMVSATTVYEAVNNLSSDHFYVIDIRSAVDYAAGHIPTAVNVALGDLLTHVAGINASSYDKIVVACYTGQTAGFATSILRMAGYNNAADLKWGMSSWTATTNKWTTNCGNGRSAQFTTTETAKNAAGNLPSISTGNSGGQAILTARLQTVLTEGFDAAKISNGDLYNNLSGSYVVNYWSKAHYDMGHIAGAVQYTPITDLKAATGLKTLPADKPVVIYCYTGQTSAHVAAYLRVLGYNAKSLLFGANAMNYDAMPGTKFDAATEVHDYALVQ